MSLILPNLDDKPFVQIAEEARSLIPSSAPEWTDHNIHDPGITFVELFAWLAEVEHYRLNQTAATSYERFFSLMGLTPLGAQAAEVTVAFEFDPLRSGLLVPSNTKIWAIGIESIPFQTTRDSYLTKAKLKKVVTHTNGREIVQTTAEKSEVGYYEAFGPAPAIDDFLRLEFDEWFAEPRGQLEILLFEDDLPSRTPLSPQAEGFESSAKVRWEYRTDPAEPNGEWQQLEVIYDGTLNFSRSGDLIFRSPEDPAAGNHRQLRAVLSEGRYEIPPRIVSIRTNVIRARQVETIVNEILGGGLGTADQLVRLQKAPLFINAVVDDGPFQVGDVLDWKALTDRLLEAEQLFESPLKETVLYVASRLREILGTGLENFVPIPGDVLQLRQYLLAQAFDTLISSPDFYQPGQFLGVPAPQDSPKFGEDPNCLKLASVRRFNRSLLQAIFPDLLPYDGLVVQTSLPGGAADDGPQAWRSWEKVESFLESGPDDRHYVLDPIAGTILFGNGLNGRVPEVSELIRARFYRYSQMEKGNVPAGHQWMLGLALPDNTQIVKRANVVAAAGGREKETLEETKIRSREVFRKETAILTGKDYETLTLGTPGLRVARVKVVPNFSPRLSMLKLPGEVTIIVAPQPPPRKAFPNAGPSEPSDGFLRTIRNYLERRRLVTTNIHVIGPRFVPVSVSSRVFLKKRVAEAQARERINQTLVEFLDPVFGGPQKGRGWPFGRSVFPSEVSQQLSRLEGVDYVTRVALNNLQAGESLGLPYNGLPTSGAHAITVIPFEARGQEADLDKGGDNCG